MGKRLEGWEYGWEPQPWQDYPQLGGLPQALEKQEVQTPQRAPQLLGTYTGRRVPITSGFENQWGLASGAFKIIRT